MNVLMVTGDTSVLTEGSAALTLLKEQSRTCNRLVVIVLNGRFGHTPARKVNDSLWVFPTNSWLPFLKIYNALYIVRHEIFFQNLLQADLIVGNDPNTAGLAAYIIAQKYKKPLHIHIDHNPFSKTYMQRGLFNVFLSIIAWFIMRYALTITVTDENTRSAVAKFNTEVSEHTTVIPKFYDIDAIEADTSGEDLHVKYTQFRAIILVVAPLTREQNVEVAIRALKDVSEYYLHIGLVIVGDGPRRGALRRLAKKLEVADQVIFEKPRANLMSYYKSAHMLMVTALHEAYETTIEEAAAAGCAIVSTPVGIAPLIIEHEKSGYLCDPKVQGGFSGAAGALIRNESLRRTIRNNIVASMQAHMSTNKDEHVQLYKKSWEAALRATRGT